MRSAHRLAKRIWLPGRIVPAGVVIALAVVLSAPGAALALFSGAPSPQTASVTAAAISSPAGFTATATGSSTASLSWTAPAALTGYTLSQSPGTLAGCSPTPSSGTASCTATGLLPATTYTWTLTAAYNNWASAPAQASATTLFSATSLGSATGTCVLVVCTGPSITTTSASSELILVYVKGSGSTTTTVSSISGPFTATAQLASVEYPTSTGENYLFAWKATGNGAGSTPVLATFSLLSLTASVWIDVVQLGPGESPLACSGCTDNGTTSGTNQSALVQATVQHSSDSEIAFLGTATAATFTAPSGFTTLAGDSANFETYENQVVQSSAAFGLGASSLGWGTIGVEVQP